MQVLIVGTARYEESLTRTGEPIPLDTVDNLDMRIDARARGVSTLDLTIDERLKFLLPEIDTEEHEG